jgi:hypothetical protein
MLNWVEIRGVGRPICDLCNAVKGKPSLNCVCPVYRSIVLHKQVAVIKLLKNGSHFCLANLKVGVCGVPMLRRLKITVYNIAIRPPIVLKAPLDHDLYILAYIIGLYHLFMPLLL